MASEVRRTAHLPEWKVKEVSELVEPIGKSRVVGVVGMREIPASDLQQMRGALTNEVEVKTVRNNITSRALDPSSQEIKPLADFIEDQSALASAEEIPSAHSMFEKAKRPMAMRAGARHPRT